MYLYLIYPHVYLYLYLFINFIITIRIEPLRFAKSGHQLRQLPLLAVYLYLYLSYAYLFICFDNKKKALHQPQPQPQHSSQLHDSCHSNVRGEVGREKWRTVELERLEATESALLLLLPESRWSCLGEEWGNETSGKRGKG